VGQYWSWICKRRRWHQLLSIRTVKRVALAGSRCIPVLHRVVRRTMVDTANSMKWQPSIPARTEEYLRPRLGYSKPVPCPHGMMTPHVTHCIGSLIPGGAERQLCNLVSHSARRGLEINVVTLFNLTGDSAHYVDLLRRTDIIPIVAGSRFDPKFEKEMLKTPGCVKFLDQLPEFLLPGTADIFGELLRDPPDILHSWLDHNNICAGVAGLLAGVPAIILSTRNVNPTHFPYLSHPFFKPWYQLLADSPRVHFINNSRAGAQDYADWLGVPVERFHVVLNGVDFDSLKYPNHHDIDRFRREIELPDGAPLVAGVFRLSDEKRPLVFAEVVRRAMLQLPHLHAVIAGVGPREADLRKAIADAGVSHRFHLLGRRTDIPVIMTAADVFLLTSQKEGTPNVLLEAQWFGCPVVATKAGGAADAVTHNETGLLVDVDDIDGLTTALVELLANPERCARLGKAGPDFVMSRFGIERMVDETLAVYQHALSQDVQPRTSLRLDQNPQPL
jgi:glycosyltransferase involved in cell wall biosynthesis